MNQAVRASARLLVCSRTEATVARGALLAGGRFIHSCGVTFSAAKPGPVETKLRKQLAEFKLPEELDLSVIKPGPDGKRTYRCVHVVYRRVYSVILCHG